MTGQFENVLQKGGQDTLPFREVVHSGVQIAIDEVFILNVVLLICRTANPYEPICQHFCQSSMLNA